MFLFFGHNHMIKNCSTTYIGSLKTVTEWINLKYFLRDYGVVLKSGNKLLILAIQLLTKPLVNIFNSLYRSILNNLLSFFYFIARLL